MPTAVVQVENAGPGVVPEKDGAIPLEADSAQALAIATQELLALEDAPNTEFTERYYLKKIETL